MLVIQHNKKKIKGDNREEINNITCILHSMLKNNSFKSIRTVEELHLSISANKLVLLKLLWYPLHNPRNLNSSSNAYKIIKFTATAIVSENALPAIVFLRLDYFKCCLFSSVVKSFDVQVNQQ